VLGDKRVLENKFGATNDYPEIINDLIFKHDLYWLLPTG
jgi:hypothetical protein